MSRRKEESATTARPKGTVYDNNGYWYVRVRLPGETKRKNHPLKAPGALHAMRSDRPVEMAMEAANRLWEEVTGTAKRTSENGKVRDVCDAFLDYARSYYRDGSGEVSTCVIATRYFKDVHGDRCIGELVHTDMLLVRDAMLRNPKLSRTTINRYMQILSRRLMPWALDRGLIRAATKVELSQVAPLKRGRTTAHECPPVREASDALVEAACRELTPHVATMVRVHRLTGMRPGELCDMRREDIDRSTTPWIYRPPHHKNDWRGEWGQPRVVLIGPRARALLEEVWGDERTGHLFSPAQSVAEWIQAKRAARKTPFYPCRDESYSRAKPGAMRRPGEKWTTSSYNDAIERACFRADVEKWSPNQLRHSFATEVRRRFGLEACRAMLGHSMGAAVTDRYSYAAIEDEMIAKARKAVEALG